MMDSRCAVATTSLATYQAVEKYFGLLTFVALVRASGVELGS